MARHEVACYDCGRMFDYEAQGGLYLQRQRRYVCPSCMRAREARQNAASERKLRTAMIWKVIVGVIFLIVAVTGEPGTVSRGGFVSTGFLIGGGFLAWGLIPYLRNRRAGNE
jgi:hypothetical protein